MSNTCKKSITIQLKSLKSNILPILFRLFTHLCLFFCYSSSMIRNINLYNEITARFNNRNSKFFKIVTGAVDSE